MNMLSHMITILFVMIGVAFLTIMEQKVLSYIQMRKSPNSVGFIGILQPFSDAVKLFLKESVTPTMSNYLIYMISPLIGLFNSLFGWLIYHYLINCTMFNLGLMFFSCTSISA